MVNAEVGRTRGTVGGCWVSALGGPHEAALSEVRQICDRWYKCLEAPWDLYEEGRGSLGVSRKAMQRGTVWGKRTRQPDTSHPPRA